VGTLGARRLADSYGGGAALPAQAVIGEPTSLQVARAHKGHVKMRIALEGRSAHSGYPHLGRNAIEPAGRVIGALAELRRELEAEEAPNRHLFPEVPFVPLNVGTVHGGSAINVVPDRCAIELGFRPLPGSDSAAIFRRIEAAARRAAAPFEPASELLSDSPPLLLPEGAPIHRAACAAAGQAHGGSVSFATDAGWLATLGIDCAVFGPGSIEVAHRPNEFMPKDEFARAPALLADLVRHFCGRAA
jgi:acetylornithine deacetylase